VRDGQNKGNARKSKKIKEEIKATSTIDGKEETKKNTKMAMRMYNSKKRKERGLVSN